MVKEKFYGRWYSPKLNPLYYAKEKLLPDDDASMEIRRTDSRIANAVHDIQSKMEIVSYHKHMVEERLVLSKKNTPALLRDLAEEMPQDTAARAAVLRRWEMFCEFYDYILVGHLEGMLVQTKAFLDSFTQLYSAVFQRGVRSFSSKGTKLLNDIANLPSEMSAYSEELTCSLGDCEGQVG